MSLLNEVLSLNAQESSGPIVLLSYVHILNEVLSLNAQELMVTLTLTCSSGSSMKS